MSEHPQRCETCSHYGGHICYQQHNRMSNIELTLIEMVGCASHSSTRPHPAPALGLNTQPKECTCEDCQRFRHPECPYPDSNITMDRCCAFMADVVSIEAEAVRKAREEFAKDLKKRLRKTWEDAKEMSDDPEWENQHSFSLLYLEKEIAESLRSTQQQAGEQHE